MVKVNKKGVSIVIPVYNEEKIIEKNVNKLNAEIKKIGCPYEIILSENGSTDRTKKICKRIAKHNKHVRVIINNKPSFAKAIIRGVKKTKCSYLAVLGADLWDATFIKRAYKEINKNKIEVVFGARYLKKGKHRRPLIRKIVSKANTFLVNLLYGTTFNDVNAIKLYKRETGLKILKKTKSSGAFLEVEIAVIIKNSDIPYKEIYSSHIEMETRHLKYVMKIILNGIWELITRYVELKKKRIKVSST